MHLCLFKKTCPLCVANPVRSTIHSVLLSPFSHISHPSVPPSLKPNLPVVGQRPAVFQRWPCPNLNRPPDTNFHYFFFPSPSHRPSRRLTEVLIPSSPPFSPPLPPSLSPTRSWPGLHCLPQSRVHDADADTLGHPVLYHAAAAGTRQPGRCFIQCVLVVVLPSPRRPKPDLFSRRPHV